MPSLTIHQRVSRLWCAALQLEAVAKRMVDYLPPEQKTELNEELKLFTNAISRIRGK